MKTHAIPKPTHMPLTTWALKVVDYLLILDREVSNPSPKAVQLEHRKENAKATTDGLLMWCPINQTVIVAKDGQWYPLELGDALPIMGIVHHV